jgi:hypothetical protein
MRRLFPVFLLWSAVMFALWLILAIGQAFVDVRPIEWLILVPPVCYILHAIAVAKDKSR